MKGLNTVFLAHKETHSTGGFTETLHGFALSAKNTARARLGKSFIKHLSTVILPNKASKYCCLHTNATRLPAVGEKYSTCKTRETLYKRLKCNLSIKKLFITM